MKSFLRLAAITLASTALVAGVGSVPATAAPGDSASIAIGPATLGTFKGATSTRIPVTFTASRPNLTAVQATVNVNGVPVANGVYVDSSGFNYQQAWGAGVVTLTNLTDFGNQAVAGGSNAAQVRYGINQFDGAPIKKRGKKLTFKVKIRYINASGRPVGVRKVALQIKKGSKWKTVKNIKLKKNGTRTVKRTDKKKRSYRLVVKSTSLYTGTYFQTRGKI